MSNTRQYIGARYVPIFGRKDEDYITWDNTKPYEPLTIVLYEGNSYTSRKYVPSGIEITNTDYWAETGNFNAQIETYRNEVLQFDDRITNVENDIEALQTDIDKLTLRGTDFNCVFRKIMGQNNDFNTTYSVQAFTIIKIGTIPMLIQAAELENGTNIVMFNMNNDNKITEIIGNYGHINSLGYKDNILYAFDSDNMIIHCFTVTGTAIAYSHALAAPEQIQALAFDENGFMCVVPTNLNNSIIIKRYNAALTNVTDVYEVEYDGIPVVQDMAIANKNIFVAMTEPNCILHYNYELDYYFYFNAPAYVGHCFIDEIEGVYFDYENSELYFNTYSTVDFQILTSVFKTNLLHNTPKEVQSSQNQDRRGYINCRIDAVHGSLVSPAAHGNTFMLAGDAINYAKAIGNYTCVLDFLTDYPYVVNADGANIEIKSSVGTASNPIELSGFYLRDCNVFVNAMRNNERNMDLIPSELDFMKFGDIYYGVYCVNSNYRMSSEWANFNSYYSANLDKRKLYALHSTLILSNMLYITLNNCIVSSTTADITTISQSNFTNVSNVLKVSSQG